MLNTVYYYIVIKKTIRSADNRKKMKIEKRHYCICALLYYIHSIADLTGL